MPDDDIATDIIDLLFRQDEEPSGITQKRPTVIT